MILLYIFNVLLFLTYCYGFGYSLTLFWQERSFEKHLVRIGVGLAAFPVLGIILGRLHVPLDWRIFLTISLIPGLVILIKRITHKKPIFSKTSFTGIDLAVTIIFLITATVYTYGSFRYPWLEDDDSWQHAASVKYIAVEKNIEMPSGFFQYVNPYPPGYDIVLGVMHQSSPSSLSWTLKFFNSLIVALSLLFFFAFVRQFTQDRQRALMATFFLAVTPCYLSHFIWAHALIVPLFFPAFYCLLKTREEKNFWLPAVIVCAAIFLIQPTQAIKFFFFVFFLWVTTSVIEKKTWKNPIAILTLAMCLSLLWWGPVIKNLKSGKLQIATRNYVTSVSNQGETTNFLKALFHPAGGTATRAYTLEDYFFPPVPNKINNPVGIGIPLCYFAIVGLGFIVCTFFFPFDKPKRIYHLTLFLWFIFVFLGLNSLTFHLPVGLFAFRFWMLLAFVTALLATEAILLLKHFFHITFIRRLVLCLLTANVLISSGYDKFRTNTTIWPPGEDWESWQELGSYLWMKKNLPPNSKIFAFTHNFFVLGVDMYSDYWSPQYQKDFLFAQNLDEKELYYKLKKHNFEYIIIGPREEKHLGKELVERKKVALSTSPHFECIYEKDKAVVIFRVLNN